MNSTLKANWAFLLYYRMPDICDKVINYHDKSDIEPKFHFQ